MLTLRRMLHLFEILSTRLSNLPDVAQRTKFSSLDRGIFSIRKDEGSDSELPKEVKRANEKPASCRF